MGKFKTRYKSITGTSLVEIIFNIFGLLLAASLGSFYVTLSERVLLYFYGKKRKGLTRLEKWKIVLFTPSHCEICSSKIPSIYLTPIFGYFFTKGKCFHCSSKISQLYPLSELLFSCWFFVIFLLTRNLIFSVFSTFLLGHVFLSMITDVKKYILDYENIPFIILFYLLSSLFYNQFTWNFESIFIGIGFFIVYSLIYKFFPNQIGLGDVFYVTCYAFLIGHPFWMFFLNIAYLTAVGVYFLKKVYYKKTSSRIPMGFYFGISFLLCFILKILVHTVFYNYLSI